MKVFLGILGFILPLNFAFSQLIPISYNLNNRELVNIASPNGYKINCPFETKHEFLLTHRSQWTGLDQAPRWSGISYNTALDDYARTGGSLYLESFGAIRSYFISGNYSYDLKLRKNSILSGGAIVRYNLNQLNISKSNIRDPADPLIANFNSASNLSISPGICYSINIPDPDIAIAIGGSVQNLISVNFTRDELASPIRAFIFHGSLIKFLSPELKNVSSIELGGVFRWYQSLSNDFHFFGKYNWQGLLSVRPGVRFGTESGFKMHAVHMELGIPIGNLIRSNNMAIDLNYVYEFPFITKSTAFGNTHEISLSTMF